MSFGSTANTIPKAKKLAGLDPSKVNSTERARPVPYFCGRAKLGVTWLGQALRQRSVKVESESEAKAGGGDSGSHKYHADMAALVCHGPVDALKEVWMDDYRVWQGNVTRSGGASSASITIEDRGVMTIYWGTETQGIDPLLAGAGHTAYRGQCYVVFNQLCLGTDSTAAPNLALVLTGAPAAGTGALVQSPWIGEAANPVHVVVELLCNQRYGAGFALSRFDLAALNTVAVQLAAEGLGISPVITEQASVREILTRLCEYVDGWLESFGDDKLRLRLTRANQTATDTLPLLGEYDLLEVPEITPQGWPDTHNQVSVKFTNAAEGYQDDSVTWYDTANLAFTSDSRATSLERSWIDDKRLATRIAAYYGRLYSVPHLAGQLKLRKEAVATVQVGDFFRFTYRDYAETVVFRVTKRHVDEARSQAVSLEVEANRYFDDILAYIPDLPAEGDTLPVQPDPVLYGRVIELPHDLVPQRLDRSQPQLLALAARASALDERLQVFSSEDGLTYERQARTRDCALYGTLAAAYPAATPILDQSNAGILLNIAGPDRDWPSVPQRRWLKERLLLFVGDEILSYRDAVVVGASQVRLNGIRRACSDTVATDHPAGAPVLMVPRKELCIFSDGDFAEGDELNVKLATATQRGMIDLSALDPLSLTLVNRTARPLPPVNLRINGNGLNPHFAPGGDVLIEWDTTHWRRHDFFANWDSAFVDDRLGHRIKIFRADGTVARRRRIAPGVSSYVYAAADLAADFGGANPSSIRVVVFSRRRGIRSLGAAEQTVLRAP